MWYFDVVRLFSAKKSKLSNVRFCRIFFFNKEEPQSCQFLLIDEKLFDFITPQTKVIYDFKG